MRQKAIPVCIFVLLLFPFAGILRAQADSADKASAIGTASTTVITLGEGYVTDTESVEAQITVLEVLRGEKAWDRIKAEDPINKPPDTGMEYIAVRVHIEYGAEGGGDQSYGFREEQFASVSQSGSQYGRPSIASLKPELSGRLYPGESLEGWVVLLVSVDDPKPLMTFGNNYNRLWFRLY